MRLLFIVIALTFSYSVDAFNTIASNISPSMRTTTQRRNMSFLRMSDLRDNSADEDTSYDGASSDLQKQGEKEYDAMFDDSDDEINFTAKKDDLDDLKERVRARAAKMEISESIATAQAIAIAEARARNKEEWDYDEITKGQNLEGQDEGLTEEDFPTKRPPLPIFDQFIYALIDVSGFKTDPDEMYDPGELSELDLAEIENIDLTPVSERVMFIVDNAKPPSWNTANNLFSLMWVVFLSLLIGQTVWDMEVMEFFRHIGFLPYPGSVSYADFQGLEAPDGFTLGMTPEELAEFAARP
eukprot:CAMPEP_0171325256 /NCGR_PEP_ID=MMETSP0816-20121228/116697_1 /TAXON_ID=420281 /ORGANISM="Proboscia inermis, Strain CCAP1064/1" /LENGTH=297 /DNA_ID=CAMNT_0011824393 /DNA_START=474 /DNA_END=1367 /DNA_ORIENTATION=-